MDHVIGKSLFISGQYSDMTIIVGGGSAGYPLYTFHVHRAVICPKSEFFASHVNGQSSPWGAETREVKLPNHDPETMERVLSFLYTGDYHATSHLFPMWKSTGSTTDDSDCDYGNTPTPQTSIASMSTTVDWLPQASDSAGMNHVRVYVAAEEVCLDGLKDIAASYFGRWMQTQLHSPALADAVDIALVTAPPHDTTLRDIIARNAVAQPKRFMDAPNMSAVLDDHPALSKAILRELVENYSELEGSFTMLKQESTKPKETKEGCQYWGPSSSW